MKKWFLIASLLVTALNDGQAGLNSLRPADLRCEYLENPQGIDATQPRLSWILESKARSARGQRQTAYQVVVASSRKQLDANAGDLWDGGKVESDRSVHVRYAGKPLASHQECFWKVRVWDDAGKVSAWSEPALWTMGLLQQSDWNGKWIGLDGVEQTSALTGTDWIWFPEGQPEKSAPVATRYFRRVLTLPPDRAIKRAQLLVAADNEGTVFVKGQQVGLANSFKAATEIDLATHLRPGRNVLAVSVKNAGSDPNPAGLVALLRIEFGRAEPLVVITDSSWKTSDKETSGWNSVAFDDAAWAAAKRLGPVGMEPWKEVSGPEERRLPARWLRKEFAVEKKVRRATAHFSGLGLSELYLNGRKVGNHVLSPGLTEYPKRVFYVTFDVTKQLKRGANAVGVVLGNGRYFAPRHKVPTETRTYGFPKVLLQIHIE